MIQTILKRFNKLYPKLAKDKIANESSLDIIDRFKLCMTIAKSEISILEPNDKNMLLDPLRQQCAVIVTKNLDQNDFSDDELFVLCLNIQILIHSNLTHFIMDIFTQMLSRTVDYLRQLNNQQSGQQEVPISTNKSLNQQFDLCLQILHYAIKYENEQQMVQNMFMIFQQAISATLSATTNAQQFNLRQFYPQAMYFRVIDNVLRNKHYKGTDQKRLVLDQLFGQAYFLFDIYKQNSQLHQNRESKLFSEILDLTVGFSCTYLRKLVQSGDSQAQLQEMCVQLYKVLFEVSESKQYFTLKEKLRILNELNTIFSQIRAVQEQPSYWQTIKQGLTDTDGYCRKIALGILQFNLDTVKGIPIYEGVASQKEFETMWKTFFDIYDALDSFGSQPTKKIWPKTEIFYQFMKDKMDHSFVHTQMNLLTDFREWLIVLYQRVQSHNDVKVRKLVQKSTLRRDYMTTHMSQYMFNDFLSELNQGLIFKDSNMYTQFSKNNKLVIEFFVKYLSKESVDKSEDLRKLFKGFVSRANHPQLVHVLLTILSKDYKNQSGEQIKGFIGSTELKQVLQVMVSQANEKYCSNKFLTAKHTLIMLKNYLSENIQSDDWNLLFKVISLMPMEFFSVQTVLVDQEGHQAAYNLISNHLGIQNLRQMIGETLQNILCVKAHLNDLPNIGGDANLVIKGLSKLALSSFLCDPEGIQQFANILNGILGTFDQHLSSSYLSNTIIEEKVRCFVLLNKTLYWHCQPQMQDIIRQMFILPRLPQLLDRFENNLIVSLQKYELQTDKQKVQSIFGEFISYSDLITLSVHAIQIKANRNEPCLEKTVKLIWTQVLRLSSLTDQEKSWGDYLLNYVLFQVLRDINQCYSKGIKECIKNKVSDFFLQEDVFNVGKPLLNNLITFKHTSQKLAESSLNLEQSDFFAQNGLNINKVHQTVLFSSWAIIAELIAIFQYDQQSKKDLDVINPIISEKAINFLNMINSEGLTTSVFKVLKTTYLPLIMQRAALNMQQNQFQEVVLILEEYQGTVWQAWENFKQLGTDFEAEALQEMLEFMFNPDLLEFYQNIKNGEVSDCVKQFHHKLASEYFEHADKFWLLTRTMFNHLMVTIYNKPQLIRSFEPFIVNLATVREIKSIDAQIMLHQLKMMIPEIVPKKYEVVSMNEITYQGAYIRAMTLIVVESMIQNFLKQVQSGAMNMQMEQTLQGFENIILMLMDVNFEKRYENAEIPYADKHRFKVRVWQFLIVMLQLLDPKLYTEQFRQQRKQSRGLDIIEAVNDRLWKVIKMTHLSSLRQLIDIYMIRLATKYPDVVIADPRFMQTLLDQNVKQQIQASFINVAGYVITRNLDSANAVSLKQRIYEQLLGFATSSNANPRCLAQFFLLQLTRDPQFNTFIPDSIRPFLHYLQHSKDINKILKKYNEQHLAFEKLATSTEGAMVTLSTQIDSFGEFLDVPFLEGLKNATSEVLTQIRSQDLAVNSEKDFWENELDARKKEGDFQILNPQNENVENQNYERKVLPWDQIEKDYEKQMNTHNQRERNEVIMCASLIDKIPNLAGLTRTCELMNASCLVINNGDVTKNAEYKSIAVTSEYSCPLYEVQEKHLYDYLQFQKSKGYKILGLEQTANSKMLNEYQFPSKSILLLGREKEGIPQEYLNILDECIEIPQFGIIRSLNVHVSGALCLWEYTRQHLPTKA